MAEVAPARTATFAEATLPLEGRRWRQAALVVAFGTLMWPLARVAIPLPFSQVPITGQTLGVLLAGALLGGRGGALAMLSYLAEGLSGLPVFAGGLSAWSPSAIGGPPVIVGPTAGYLFSYPIAAYLVGALAERGWDRRFGTAVAAMLLGEVAIYAIGLAWLARFVGAAQAVPLGLFPFIPGDMLKLFIAAAVLPSAWRLLALRGAERRRRR